MSTGIDARPAFYSRYSRGRFVWDVERAPLQESLTFLEGVAGEIGRRAILVPTSDGTAMWVADHAEELRRWFDFPAAEPALVRSLCSKREMFLLAKQYGIPSPETAFPQSLAEVIEYAKTATFPLMAKGVFGIELERKAGKRMFIVHDSQQLLALYQAHEDWFRPNFILQEYIPGNAESCWMFNGYFDAESNCKISFTGRKIRQYPYEAV